jgi:alpha-amylase/alpha-mannosidase (GH57 family)
MEKKDIALQQLIDSANLYQKGRYCSALTLAGAAEEILGKIAKKRTGKNQIEDEIEYLKSIYQCFNKPVPTKRELINRINNAKNELKHNDVGENLWVDSDFENECVLLFVKAVKNYFDAYKEMPKSKIVMRLFEHLCL